MNASRALALLSQVSVLAAGPSDEAFYRGIESALGELVGFKLLTLLRLRGPALVRMHSSDLAAYPAGGSKDITHDLWLRSMLENSEPVLSEGEAQVRARFFDHEAIFALGCGSVLNIPVRSTQGTLGSLNLLHEAGWFTPEHVALARLFATPLALVWLAQEVQVGGVVEVQG